MRRPLVILVLVLAVGGLWWLTNRRQQELVDPGVVYEAEMFPNLDVREIVELRIENLERGLEVRFTRDENHMWSMIDPIESRANDALIHSLLDELTRGRAKPASEVEPGQVGLGPPRAVVTFVADNLAGAREGRLELGQPGVQGRFLHAAIPGHPSLGDGVLRVSRALETMVDFDRDSFRDPVVFERSRSEVLRIERSGSARLDGDAADSLDLVLERDGQGGWRIVRPVAMKADRDVANTVLRAMQDLRVQRFLPPGKDRPALARPPVRVALERADGTRNVLGLANRMADGPARDGRWVGRAEDVDADLEARAVLPLLFPLSTFFDTQLVRALRGDIQAIELVRGERRLLVERTGLDWTVMRDEGRSFPASHGIVEDLLAAFERAQIASFPAMVGFPSGEVARSFRVATVGGAEFSGSVGGTWRDESLGAEGRAFLRTGDELPGLIGSELDRWFEMDVADFRRRTLWSIKEGLAKSVTLRRGEVELSYVKNGTRWIPAALRSDADVTPEVFIRFLERLLLTRTSEWLDGTPELSDSTTIDLLVQGAELRRLTVGRSGERVVGQLSDGTSFVLDSAWQADLDALMR